MTIAVCVLIMVFGQNTFFSFVPGVVAELFFGVLSILSFPLSIWLFWWILTRKRWYLGIILILGLYYGSAWYYGCF